MQDLTEGLQIVEANQDKGFFGGPVNPAIVTAAEAALGVVFPSTYREFLLRLGAGDIAGFEFYGVINDDFENSAVPDAIWVTLKLRRMDDFPPNLVAISDTGDGAFYCLQLGEGQESPVIIYWPGFPPSAQKRPERVANDFGEFFLNQIRDRLESQ